MSDEVLVDTNEVNGRRVNVIILFVTAISRDKTSDWMFRVDSFVRGSWSVRCFFHGKPGCRDCCAVDSSGRTAS
jgi:uncharacterized protein YegJ (DUF2314 family)